MKYALALIGLMWVMHVEGAVPYDDKTIAAIAKKTNSSHANVIATLETGCSSGITPYMRQCSFLHAVAADFELDTVYQQLLRKLSGTRGKDRLTKAQGAWRAFRTLHCEFDASSWEGGTGHSIAVHSCESNMAEKRTKELEKYLACEETGCPGSD